MFYGELFSREPKSRKDVKNTTISYIILHFYVTGINWQRLGKNDS